MDKEKSYHWGRIVMLAISYCLLARLGLHFAVPPENKATAIWPPSGLAMVAVYLWGGRAWPGVWLGAFAANLFDYLINANSLSAHLNVMVSAAIASGSTLQAIVAGLWLQRVNGDRPFESVAQTFRFLMLTPAVCLIAASFGTLSLLAAGFAPVSSFLKLWSTWWLGDCTGMLVMGSLLLSWLRPNGDTHSRSGKEGGLPLVIGLMVPATAAFGVLDHVSLPPPLAYLVLPLLIWSTFVYRLRGATSALGLVSLLAIAGAAAGRGPFGYFSRSNRTSRAR